MEKDAHASNGCLETMNMRRGNEPHSTNDRKHVRPRSTGAPGRFVIALSDDELRYSEIPIDRPSANTEENPTTATVRDASFRRLALAATVNDVITPSTPPSMVAFKKDMSLFFFALEKKATEFVSNKIVPNTQLSLGSDNRTIGMGMLGDGRGTRITISKVSSHTLHTHR